MKRQLSAREVILLGLLIVMASVGAYALLFYIPMTTELDNIERDKALCEEQIEPATLRVEDKKRMERELEKLFEENPEPMSLAPYDNQTQVMIELNAVLRNTSQYNISFGTAETEREDGIVRRRISLSYTSGSYEMAKEVLRSLHDSAYRCMLDSLSVATGMDGSVTSVNVGLVFFEYKE